MNLRLLITCVVAVALVAPRCAAQERLPGFGAKGADRLSGFGANSNEWKLVIDYVARQGVDLEAEPLTGIELYDLDADPTEQRSLVASASISPWARSSVTPGLRRVTTVIHGASRAFSAEASCP